MSAQSKRSRAQRAALRDRLAYLALHSPVPTDTTAAFLQEMDHRWANGRGRPFRASAGSLMRATGLSRSTVNRRKTDGLGQGWLVITERGGRGRLNRRMVIKSGGSGLANVWAFTPKALTDPLPPLDPCANLRKNPSRTRRIPPTCVSAGPAHGYLRNLYGKGVRRTATNARIAPGPSTLPAETRIRDHYAAAMEGLLQRRRAGPAPPGSSVVPETQQTVGVETPELV